MKKISSLMPSFLDELDNIEMEKRALFGLPTAQEAGNYVRGIPKRTAQFARNLPSNTAQFIRNTPQRTATGIERIGEGIANFGHPIKNIGRGWNATWNPGGKALHPGFKALMALQAYGDIKATAAKEDPTGRGRSRIHRGLSAAGAQIGGLIGAPVQGFAAPIVTSMLGQKMGDLAGRGIDRLRGYQTPPHLPPPPQGQ